MIDGNGDTRNGSKSRNVPSDFKLEMIKQKISLNKLLFVTVITMAIGLESWLSNTDWNEIEENPGLLLTLLQIEPILLFGGTLVFLMLMILLLLAEIQYHIGELGDPSWKKMGIAVPIGTVIAAAAFCLILSSDVFEKTTNEKELFGVVLTVSSVFAICLVLITFPYRRVATRLRGFRDWFGRSWR